MEPKKLEEVDLVIIRGVAASEREIMGIVAKHQQDAATAFAHIAGRHGLDPALIGKEYGFDLEAGCIVKIQPSQDEPPKAPASVGGIDPRKKKGR